MTKYTHYQKSSYIKNSVWNNNFSYNQRILKWLVWNIHIPSIIYTEEDPSDKIVLSDKVCFEEIDENNNIQKCIFLTIYTFLNIITLISRKDYSILNFMNFDVKT